MGSLPQGTCWKRRISGPARSRPRRALCIFLWRRASGPESTGGRVTTIQNGKVYGASVPVIEAGAPIACDHTEGGQCVPDTYAHRPAERYGHPPGRGDAESYRSGGSLSLIHISEPTRLRRISYAVFCLK